MMRRAIYSLLLFLIMNLIVLAQSINIGFRSEWLTYSYINLLPYERRVGLNPFPITFYAKASIVFSEKYEIEIKSGIQPDGDFSGIQSALLLKYNWFNGITPVVTYLIHFNSGKSRNAGGAYQKNFNFVGGGIEAKLTKVFAADLIYYKPIGDKQLAFTYNIPNTKTTSSQIDWMLKLGLVFSFDMWEL